MSRPTFIAAGAIATDTGGPASTTPTPPTHVAQDILIAAAYNANGDAMSTATGGWAEIAAIAGTDDLVWFWKRATAAGTAGPTITAAGTDQFAICYVIRGCVESGTPYEDATTNNDATTAATTPDTALITTVGTDRLVMCFAGWDTNIGFSSGNPPANWTSNNNTQSAAGTGIGFGVISIFKLAADDQASVVVGTLSASVLHGTLTVAFIPGITIDSWVENTEQPYFQKRTISSGGQKNNATDT
jgi:hypothetical protein